MSILRRIPVEEVSAAAKNVWFNKSIADIITTETMQIISNTFSRKFSFFTGKSFNGLIGGLFYLLGYRHGVVKKQNEIADRLGTTDVTIRISYRKWLETFPDLFMDVIRKFASNIALQPFVLLDMKQSLLKSEINHVCCASSTL